MPAEATSSAQTFGNTAPIPVAHALRAGVIGLGFIGEVHVRALRAAGATLVGVADATPERSRASAERLGALWGTTDAQALVTSPDIDVVHICTPNHLHAPLARLAIAAGKHVVCEKPLATTLADARELASSARAAGVVAAVPFIYRYYPMVREARARVHAGSSGPVRLIHGSYLQDWLSRPEDQNWRVDPRIGGASRTFADIGVHWCDLVEFVTGHRIVSVASRLTTAVTDRVSSTTRGDAPGADGVGTEDAAMLLFETDHGAMGSLVASQVTPGRKNRLWFSVDGAATSLAFDQERPESLWVGSREQTAIMVRGSERMAPEAARLSVLPAGHPQGYQDCFNGFVADVYAAAAGNQPDGLPQFTDGLRAAALTEAVLASSASRSWVGVPA